MFSRFKKIIEDITNLNSRIDTYKEDTVIQSLPSVAYVNRAKKAIDKGQYKDALELLHQAESLPQEDALVYKYQGIIYDKLFRFDDAVRVYKKSANLNCNDKIIWKNLGFALINVKLYEEAQEAFENADKITPGNSEVLMGWGMALMKLEKFADAREKFVLSVKMNKYNSNALFLAAVMEIKLKMYDEAENKLQFLANVSPNEANSFEYARLKFLKKDYESAGFFARKALEFNKNMLPAYLLLGTIFRLKNEKELSFSYYKKAEELSLLAQNLYVEWAVSLIKFEEFEQAMEKLNRALELGGENSEIKVLKNICNLLEGEEENKPLLEDTLNEPENPIKPLIYRALGMKACAEGNYVDGIHFFKSALKEDPSDVVNYYYIAKSYLHANENSNAKEYFETSIKENPKHLKSYIDYSKFLISVDDFADANRKLRKALKQDENNLEILNMLFYVNYILVKQNVCEYNIKETLNFEKQIKAKDENAFKYPDKSAELAELLNKLQEKD